MCEEKQYKIKHDNNRVHMWTLSQVLDEINRERSGDWVNYNESDWKEGWAFWVETNPDESLSMLDKDDELTALCERYKVREVLAKVEGGEG